MAEQTKRVLSGLTLNDNKAGMESLDKDKINKIIHEASKGSRFYEKELKKEEEIKNRIEKQQIILNKLSPQQISEAHQLVEKMKIALESERNFDRTIVHIDMDAYYAAVEMRDDPSLKARPMAVGSNSMLSTSNYLARRYGVRAAMPGFIAKKLCPDLVIVPPNFEKYTAVSKDMRVIMAEYDPNYCPMSLDEAYLDITDHLIIRQTMPKKMRTFCKAIDAEKQCTCDASERPCRTIDYDDNHNKNTLSDLGSINLRNGIDYSSDNSNEYNTCLFIDESNNSNSRYESCGKYPGNIDICPLCGKTLYNPSAEENNFEFGLDVTEAVRELRFRIQHKTRLTASAGIAPNMMLAKVCSDKNKPNGQYIIEPTKEAVMEFVKDLPIRKICGIGKVTEKMLSALDIVTCTDLFNNLALVYHLYSSISFNYFLRICLGMGSTKVERDEGRKSISVERTFSEIKRPEQLFTKCEELVHELADDLEAEDIIGKTVTIKIKTIKFEVKTRAFSMVEPTSSFLPIFNTAKKLLLTEIEKAAPLPLRLRLMGVRLSNLLPRGNDSMLHKQPTITSMLGVCHSSSSVHNNDSKSSKECKNENAVVSSGARSFQSGKNTCENSYVSGSRDSCNKIEKHTEEKTKNADSGIIETLNENAVAVGDVKNVRIISEIPEITSLKRNLRNKFQFEKLNVACDTSDDLAYDDIVSVELVHLNEQTSDTSELKNGYTCPVCSACISCSKNTDFNKHLDICLGIQNDSARKISDNVNSRSIDDVSKPNNASKKRTNNKAKSFSTKKKTVVSKDYNSSTITNWISQSQDVRISVGCESINDEDRKIDILCCPICNTPQPKSQDLAAFNSHVDSCLSRRTIHTILEEQKQIDQPNLKRKVLTSSQQSQSKRKKTYQNVTSSQNTTIDSFFK